MEIEKTINRWFQQRQELISKASIHDKSFTLSFCAVSVPIMKTYCSAAGLLLDKDFKLPTIPLLRAISEFFIKFIWCVNTEDENEVKKRAARWEKSTATEKLKLLNSLLANSSILASEELPKLRKIKADTQKNLDSNKNKLMPKVTGAGSLFEQCLNVFGADVSGILYRQFCGAVHIDTSILRGLMGAGVDDSGNLVLQDDISEGITDLKKKVFKLYLHVFGYSM